MADLVYGHGVMDLIREVRFFASILAQFKLQEVLGKTGYVILHISNVS